MRNTNVATFTPVFAADVCADAAFALAWFRPVACILLRRPGESLPLP